MKLKVLLFGISTDLTGENTLDLELNKNASVADFKDTLQRQYPKLTQLNSYAIAVNESYANDDTQLHENDTVAVIPPVSGG
ncbi:MoaD/ThiS family protein [Pseudotenacibaculum haliotis]|uniref:Molybdopterin synthase sulfur carrier subunit n=1 Tax=Pseudotenacibaculum haliotis TaxID=1862138 RepID=A0ABW5LQU3_9FLAO